MLRDFRIALSAKLRETLRVDSDPGTDKCMFDFLDYKIGPLYMAVGGFFSKLDPEHVIQLVCYNISLYLVAAVFIILFICTLIFKELEITSLAVMYSVAMWLFMFLIAHMDFFFHRSELTAICKQMIDWVNLNRRPQDQPFSEEKLLKVIRVYWAPLVWTTWGCFMVSIPVLDYLSNGRTYSLPFPLWFPFKTDNPLGYVAAYVIEIYAVHAICSFIIACAPLYFVVCYVILEEFDSLIDSIRSMHEDALAMYKLQLGERTNVSTDPATDEEYFDLYKDRVFQSCCERLLRQINVRHLHIFRVTKEINRIISILVTLALTLAYTATGAALSLGAIGNGNIKLKLTFSATGLMDLLLIWVICHLSQKLKIKGENASVELYFTNWYHWPEVMKRSLRLMLVRSLYPPHFSAAYLDKKADYITFAAIVNSTFTFVNLVYAFTH